MRRTAHVLWLVSVLASGCGRRTLAPEEVPFDHVSCARCGMLVSDRATAGEAVFDGADTRFYDDPGCLATDQFPQDRRFETWVRVDGGKTWRKAAEAFYARPKDARTPMGYDFLAFSSRADAVAQDREGRSWSWDEVRTRLSRPEKTAGGVR